MKHRVVSELPDFMFSYSSSLGLPWQWALRVAQVESGSPGETSGTVGSEGPTGEGACRIGRACCSGLSQVDLVVCGPASF